MSLKFKWPSCGAVRDRCELEYISALAQSGNELRNDGTISADDILSFLKSRHGLSADHDLIKRAISDFGGKPSDENLEHLEIPMVVSLIIMPYLLEISEEEGEIDTTEDPFANVLDIVLNDLQIPHESRPPKLTKGLLRDLLRTASSSNISEEIIDDKILEEMIRLADSDVLDRNAFARALTSDVGCYDVRMVTCNRSYYQNFKTMCAASPLSISKHEKLKKIPAASTIDMNGDTFQSDTVFVLILTYTLVSYLAYFSGDGFVNKAIQCESTGCVIGKAIANWMWIFFQFGFLGFFLVYFWSGANRISEEPCPWLTIKQALGIAIVIGTLLPFFFQDNAENDNLFMAHPNSWQLEWAKYLALGIGIVFLIIQTSHFIKYFYPENPYFISFNCTERKERFTKQAGYFKAKQLYKNAIALHTEQSNFRTSKQALINFEQRENERETIGGIFWVRKNLARLMKEEGIWLSARVFAAWVGQLIGIFFFLFVTCYGVYLIHRQYNTTESKIATDTMVPSFEGRHLYFNESGSFIFHASEVDDEYLSVNNLEFGYVFDDGATSHIESTRERLLRNVLGAIRSSDGAVAAFNIGTIDDLLVKLDDALFNATGIHLNLVFEYIDLYLSVEGNFVLFIYERGLKRVTPVELITALIFGGVCGLIAMLLVHISYIPSTMTQVLMLRNGVMTSPSPLTDENFRDCRFSVFASTSLFGGAIWGILATGATICFLTGGTLFLCIWSQTSKYLVSFLAQLIGLTVTFLIRVVAVFLLRSTLFVAFYRKKLIWSSIATIIFEMWNVGIALGIIIGRTIKLILITCCYLGRIDVQFLTDQANGIGNFTVDGYSKAFTIDMLLHEAHRHPYLERLGLIYMLKIEHGNSFATRSDSCWRLIYTLTLFPWLHRYRKATKIGLLENEEKANSIKNVTKGDNAKENETKISDTKNLEKIESNKEVETEV